MLTSFNEIVLALTVIVVVPFVLVSIWDYLGKDAHW